MRDFVFVCTTSDVPHSSCREFSVAGRSVLICEYRGGYYAHAAICPHQEYSLNWACVWNGLIDCPWHHFTFDVVSGQNEFPKRLCPTGDPALSKEVASLATYPLEVRSDGIYVDLH